MELILGTAGHIDHGKTTLVHALTGVNTDRLPDEKRRGMTIDIGFARLDLGDYQIGVVDVPGHERFIRNMLAGATGIQVALLVVAADDSVMPQTREHLDILKLLDVREGLIAMTKCDLGEDSWMDLVEQEIRELVAGTFLADAPIVRTAAPTGGGLEELTEALTSVCAKVKPPESGGFFRLPVDRSFVMQGRGAVITGSVASGQLAVGDNVQWMPSGQRVRVRSLERHGESVSVVRRGQRAAVGLVGVHHKAIQRGHELAEPGLLRPVHRITTRLHVLSSSPWPIKHRDRLKLHLGTAEIVSTLRLVDGKTVQPGDWALAQLSLAEPAMCVRGQPFVLRRESPMVTVGGGHVLQPWARPIGRRHDLRKRIEALGSDDPAARAAAAMFFYRYEPWTNLDLCRDAGLTETELPPVLDQLVTKEIVVSLPISQTQTLRLHRDVLAELEDRLKLALEKRHVRNAIQPSIPRTQLAAQLKSVNNELLQAVIDRLIRHGELRGDDRSVARADFKPKLSSQEEGWRQVIIEAYQSGGFHPPGIAELGLEAPQSRVEQIVELCLAERLLVHVGDGIFLHSEWEKQLRERVTRSLARSGGMTLSEIRQLLETSRKFAVPLCEYLDRIGLTHRVGDRRVLAHGESGLRGQ